MSITRSDTGDSRIHRQLQYFFPIPRCFIFVLPSVRNSKKRYRILVTPFSYLILLSLSNSQWNVRAYFLP
jgi:hypothetical protein